ncbi:MAG: hypothetical protein IT443_10040 [Phycisphaeraceae bacterium]|nr:hypothetical protein [Phycisphaeraceae bacterium]
MATKKISQGQSWCSRKWLLVTAVLLIFVVTVLVVAPLIEIGLAEYWMCGVCGSKKQQSTWLWGIGTQPRVEESALAMWMAEHRLRHEHQWVYTHGRAYSLLGPAARLTGELPAISMLLSNDLMAHFVRKASEEEITAFLDVMNHGTTQQQEEAIQDACAYAISKMP